MNEIRLGVRIPFLNGRYRISSHSRRDSCRICSSTVEQGQCGNCDSGEDALVKVNSKQSQSYLTIKLLTKLIILIHSTF